MKLKFPKKSHFKLPFREYMGSPDKKMIFTERIFTDVAPVYNFILKGLSFFQDLHWKEYLVNNIPPIPQGPVIDLATGTGKIAFLLAKKFPERAITGIDITEAMLDIAKKDNTYSKVSFEKINIGLMNYEKNSVALFTGGYALRNTPDLKKLIRDIYFQLKPRGVAAFLDFSKSSNKLLQALNYSLLVIWCNFFSVVLHRNRRIYDYIPQSIRIFPDRKELGDLFTKEGFTIVRRKTFLLGITEVLIVQKDI